MMDQFKRQKNGGSSSAASSLPTRGTSKAAAPVPKVYKCKTCRQGPPEAQACVHTGIIVVLESASGLERHIGGHWREIAARRADARYACCQQPRN
jgi:hypothetical protein